MIEIKLSKVEKIIMLPSHNADTTFAELLQEFPDEIGRLAKETKAFGRSRKVQSPEQLLRAVLMFAGLDLTEREVAANLLLTNPQLGSLSDQAIHKRLSGCQAWLEALLSKLMDRSELPARARGRRIIIVDGTEIRTPGESKKRYRLHLAMDLLSLQLLSVQITDQKVGETLKNHKIAEDDVVMGDRGYSRRGGVEDVLEKKGEVIVRHNPHNFPICDLEGKPLSVVKQLKKAKPDSLSTIAATFETSKGELRPVWVHALRLSGRTKEASRQRCLREGVKGDYTPRKETLLLSEFILVLSSISPDELSAETVLTLYRCRWQIELMIKRLKSLLSLDKLRIRQSSPLSRIWLVGKLIYALLLDKRLRRNFEWQWIDLDQQRDKSCWRLWKMMRQQIEPLITGIEYWSSRAWEAVIKAISERKRNRKLQKIPSQAVFWLRGNNDTRRTSAQSEFIDHAVVAA